MAPQRFDDLPDGPADATAAHYYSEDFVASEDGTSLFVRRWLPEQRTVRAHVLIVHGYMDHSGRYAEVARALAHQGIASCAVDLRGHGRSPGQRGYIDRFEDYLSDVQATCVLMDTPCFMLGHSNGGLVALDYVVQRNPALAGLIVTNPFLAQTHPARGLKLTIGRLAGRYAPRLALPAGLKSTDLTHDLAQVRAHELDSLVFHKATAGWYRETLAAQARVQTYRRVGVPLLYVYSDADPVASPQANARLAERLESPHKTVHRRPGELHEVLNETARGTLHQSLITWIDEQVARAAAP